MKHSWIAVAWLALVAAQPAAAQSPLASKHADEQVISTGPVAATPEMWFYEQALHRYDDPKNAVRANAEFKANQRRARLAAMQWYGYSNSRPTAGIDPLHGPLQPQWVGNGYNPNYWVVPPATTPIIWAAPGVARGY